MHLTADRVVKWSERKVPDEVELEKVHFGPDPHGLGGFQVALASAESVPSKPALKALYAARKGKTQAQLVVAVENGHGVHLFGPDPQAQPIELSSDLAQRQLQSVLNEPDVFAAVERLAGFRKVHDSTAGIAGFTNHALFATHHVTKNVPQRADWTDLTRAAQALIGSRGPRLIEALGFRTKSAGSGAYLLSTGTDAPRVAAVLLDENERFESKSNRFQLSPVAHGLAVAAGWEVPWLIMLRKDQIRLYPGRDGVGVGSKGQAETYFEIDLSTVDPDYAGLLPLIFSAAALAKDGTADELLRESARYATALGARLRERIYDDIVPPVAVEVAHQLAGGGHRLDGEGLATAYRVTLLILFRLLFQAYAEDRGLLPSGRNEGFDANSLKSNATRLLETTEDQFGESPKIWHDLEKVWEAIDLGNPQWQIPAYNGGLFTPDPARSTEGGLVAGIELPDSVLGPALKHLLIDTNEDGVEGPVDFRSLSVREFGTIYEGLLESSLSLAEQDLTIDAKGAWVPATNGGVVYAPTASVYFHTASGERKATGSYFTPKVVVDHLIERSIVPALNAHLEKIAALLDAGDAPAAARDFFDFRVADLAMGSGHFLVAAVDKIEALMRKFLSEHSVPGITEELLRLAAVAKEALGTDEVAKSEVDEIALLRRQIARRCIYGLDINPMAVELARLALWIHTFVPGLPMSNLDHGLVNANSLTGIGTIEEALDALQPGRESGEEGFFDSVITDNLSAVRPLLLNVANASEASKAEVEVGARLLAEAAAAAEPSRRIFDTAVAARLRRVEPDTIFTEEDLFDLADQPIVAETATELRPAHMPYLFPEVFLRPQPGFDVILGNPPWEKLHVEEHQWWGLRLPGLRSMSAAKREKTLDAFRESRPDLEAEYEAEIERVRAMSVAVSSGPYAGLGAAHLDLYQAFAWRNWQLLRRDGRSALVLPRGALSGSGLQRWRRTILASGAFESVVFLINTGGWIFDNVHNSYTVGLTVTAKTRDQVVRFAGPFSNEKDFLAGESDLADVPGEEFASWSSTCAFPLIPGRISGQVFRQMKQSPRFDAVRKGWEFRPIQGDMNASGDKAILQFDVERAKGRIPVVAGASYNIWSPDFAVPFAYGVKKVVRPHLAKKLAGGVRSTRSAYHGLAFKARTLPMDAARIAFRDIARANDTRTAIPCLLPPGTAAVHQSPILVRRQGDEKAEAYLLGLMASIPFDWATRRWVELHLTFELLNALPVPAYDADSATASRVSEIAGRLAAVDDRYADWAADVGVPMGSVKTQTEKDDLIAELDALVSLLYGLSEDQVEHVFATFHRGWAYQARLEAVLEHYRNWKDQA